MKFLTYELKKKQVVGVLSSSLDRVIPISAFGMEYGSMLELIEHVSGSEMEYMLTKLDERESFAIPLSSVRKLAPIPVPRQDIICLGINYMAHAEESARFKKEAFDGQRPYAVYFSKRVNEAIADNDEINGHFDIVDSLDYEAELAFILRKDARNVPKEKALDYIFGYTILNDISARAIQTRHKQWYFGKSFDTFAPMGPWIVTADELGLAPDVMITSKVNGELRQNSSTGLLIFGIDHILSELSQGMTLKAGTIISTGTPAGVGMGFDPPKFLKSGDIVECYIEGIGTLTNKIR